MSATMSAVLGVELMLNLICLSCGVPEYGYEPGVVGTESGPIITTELGYINPNAKY